MRDPWLCWILVVIIFLLLGLNIVWASPGPGISVTVVDVDAFAGGIDNQASYVIRVESITTEDENVKLVVSGHFSLSFDWTLQEFVVTPGEIKEFPLTVTVAVGTGAGDCDFTASGEAWPAGLTYDDAVALDMIETSSYTDYVYVTETVSPPRPVPEFPFEMWLMISFLACGYLLSKKKIIKIN